MSDQAREIIDQQRARLREDKRGSAPIIVHHLLRRTDEFVPNRALLMQVLAPGWDKLVRAALHRPTDLPSGEQLEMWPEALREHVQRIGHRAVMVPSRGKMLALIPGEISAAEVREAGQFLLQKARETADRGRACLRLADAMED
jgi:hypothetical protein